jgi:tRNA-modifying protein YgfZ
MQVVKTLKSAISRDYFTSVDQEYDLIRQEAGVYRCSIAVFSLSGKEALDLFQRISTNDVASMVPGSVKSTVLVTEKAKIKDIVTLIVRENDVLLLSETRDYEALKLWIEKYIIIEDVVISDISDRYECAMIIGKRAWEYLKLEYKLADVEASQIQERITAFPWGILMRNTAWKSPCFTLLMDPDLDYDVSMPRIGEMAFEFARIKEQIPRVGKELTDDINPLEANLWNLVSFNKGCYIGQEIIARIDTYKKLQRRLVGLRIETNSNVVRQGKLYQSDIEVGIVTSSAWSNRENVLLALGYIRSSISNDCELEYRDESPLSRYRATIRPSDTL